MFTPAQKVVNKTVQQLLFIPSQLMKFRQVNFLSVASQLAAA